MPMPCAPVPLFRMSVRLGVSARRQSDNERFSTLSKINGLQRELVLIDGRVLGAGAIALAEDGIARSEASHGGTHRFDLARPVESPDPMLWLEQANRQAHDERRATHGEAVAHVEAGRTDFDQHVVGRDDRFCDVPQLEVIERTVPVVDNRLHDASPFIVTHHVLWRIDCGGADGSGAG